MEVTSATSSASSAAATSKNLGELTTQDFLKMLLTELTNQDPFEPVKNQDLLNQIGSIRNMEMNSQLTSTLKSLINRSDLSSAGGLIGKMVAGLTPERLNAEGIVTGVRVSQGKVLLELDTGDRINIEDVMAIAEEPAVDTGGQE